MVYVPWSVTAGEVPTAAKWNILGTNDASFNDGTGFADGIVKPQHLIAGAGSTWGYTDYSASQTFTNITKGNGTVISYYKQIGKSIHAYGKFTFGSTSSIAADGRIVPPVTMNTHIPDVSPLGTSMLHDASSGAYFQTLAFKYTGESAIWPLFTSVATAPSNPPLASLGSNSPFLWTTSDWIGWNVLYEAA